MGEGTGGNGEGMGGREVGCKMRWGENSYHVLRSFVMFMPLFCLTYMIAIYVVFCVFFYFCTFKRREGEGEEGGRILGGCVLFFIFFVYVFSFFSKFTACDIAFSLIVLWCHWSVFVARRL